MSATKGARKHKRGEGGLVRAKFEQGVTLTARLTNKEAQNVILGRSLMQGFRLKASEV
jgi:hypothetical protein